MFRIVTNIFVERFTKNISTNAPATPARHSCEGKSDERRIIITLTRKLNSEGGSTTQQIKHFCDYKCVCLPPFGLSITGC